MIIDQIPQLLPDEKNPIKFCKLLVVSLMSSDESLVKSALGGLFSFFFVLRAPKSYLYE
jgi:hypothetical protein